MKKVLRFAAPIVAVFALAGCGGHAVTHTATSVPAVTQAAGSCGPCFTPPVVVAPTPITAPIATPRPTYDNDPIVILAPLR